jgi:uncharacterized membrane protein YkvA (DUF1232 family)
LGILEATFPKDSEMVTHLPNSQPSQSQPSQSQQYELQELPSFPRTLFQVKSYDGAKTLVVLLLAIATVYLLSGLFGFLLDHNAWFHDWVLGAPTVTAPTVYWWQVWKLDVFNPIGKVLKSTMSYVDLGFRLFTFICAYCLTWVTFDPRNIEGYVMGLFNACLGAAYVFSPIDLVPDVIPVVGSFDDTIFGVGMVVLGVSSWYKTKMAAVKTKTILELVDHGNKEKALQMLLKDKGIDFKSIAPQTPPPLLNAAGVSPPALPPTSASIPATGTFGTSPSPVRPARSASTSTKPIASSSRTRYHSLND